MEQRISLITLGVSDLKRGRRFYERLGWKPSNAKAEEIVFFQAGGIALALYPRSRWPKTQTWPLMGPDSAESRSHITPELARRLTPFLRKLKPQAQSYSNPRRKPSGAGIQGTSLILMVSFGR
jgi:hypothetical protein